MPGVHYEEDAKLCIKKGPTIHFPARRIEFKFEHGSKSSRYGAQAGSRSYRFCSSRGAQKGAQMVLVQHWLQPTLSERMGLSPTRGAASLAK